MLKKLFAGAALASLVAAPMSAAAATYISKLEYWDNSGVTRVDPDFGYVLLEEAGDGKTVNVTAYLRNSASWQQSGANNIFAFNLLDDNNTQITENYTSPNVVYQNASYDHAPWGTFTEYFYVQAEEKKNDKNKKNNVASGNANASLHPFVFTAFNAQGLTFAGVDATFDVDGRLLTTGSGYRFDSNDPSQNSIGGWWFMGHIQPVGSESINIAARDAFCIEGCRTTTVVPEPATWGLMIMGFGAAGYMIRRRRYAVG